jgi:energy-coupling factor transporter ATP-binding protein EcfA2
MLQKVSDYTRCWASIAHSASTNCGHNIFCNTTDRTTVVISHSISQIIDADVIFVLEEGRVVEHGTHEELYGRGGTYSEIFNASARSLNIDKISRTLDIELAPDVVMTGHVGDKG